VCDFEPPDFGYPEPALSTLRSLSVLSLNIFSFVSPSCWAGPLASFYYELVLYTIGPLVVVASFFGFYLWVWPHWNLATRCWAGPPATRDERLTRALAWSIAFILLVLSPVSTAIIQTFVCTEFDDGVTVLSAEMTLSCDPRISETRRLWMAYAGLMALIYPIGTPLCLLWVLYHHKGAIMSVMASAERDLNAPGDAESRRATIKGIVKGDSQRGIRTTPLFFAVKSMFGQFEGRWVRCSS
jgi:hypothetical protein